MNSIQPHNPNDIISSPEKPDTSAPQKLAAELSPLIKALRSDIRWQKLIRFVYKAFGTLLFCQNLKERAEIKSKGICKADRFVEYLDCASSVRKTLDSIATDLPAADYAKTLSMVEKFNKKEIAPPAKQGKPVTVEAPAEPVSVVAQRGVSQYKESFGNLLNRDFSNQIAYDKEINNSCAEYMLLAVAALLYEKDSQPEFSFPEGKQVNDNQISVSHLFGDFELWTKGATNDDILEFLRKLDSSKVYIMRTSVNGNLAGHFQLLGQHDNEWYIYSTMTNQVKLTEEQGTVMSEKGSHRLVSAYVNWGKNKHSIGYLEINQSSRANLNLAVEYVKLARIYGEEDSRVTNWLIEKKTGYVAPEN